MVDNFHILIAEDEAMSAMYLEMALKKEGYDVTIVATGQNALEVYNKKRADVVLMDIHLADEMDGIETSKKIRDIEPVPVIFMTGYQKETFVSQVSDFDYAALLIKPINIKELQRLLNEILLNS